MRNVEDYKGIIFGLAFKFSPNAQELEDFVSEGFVCFMEVIQEENKVGLACSFEQALSTRFKQHLLCKCKERKQMKRAVDLIPMEDVEYSLGKNPWKAIEDYISLSKEMKDVVDTIINSPAEFVDLLRIDGFKTGLSKYLRKHKGWRPDDIKRLWEEYKIWD